MQLEEQFRKGSILYFARVLPNLGIYDLCELSVRMVGNNWISARDKRDKRVYLFSKNDINHKVFVDREDALSKVKELEKYKTNRVFTRDKDD